MQTLESCRAGLFNLVVDWQTGFSWCIIFSVSAEKPFWKIGPIAWNGTESICRVSLESGNKESYTHLEIFLPLAREKKLPQTCYVLFPSSLWPNQSSQREPKGTKLMIFTLFFYWYHINYCRSSGSEIKRNMLSFRVTNILDSTFVVKAKIKKHFHVSLSFLGGTHVFDTHFLFFL